MRKRRRLANKMTIMVCAVLIAVSAFFYAPMEVCASAVTDDFTGVAIDEDGVYKYFEDGVVTGGKGIIIYDGYYYYVRSGGQVAVSSYTLPDSPGHYLPPGTFQFDSQGRMTSFIPSERNGIKFDCNCKKGHYYINGVPTPAGLVLYDGHYYYISTSTPQGYVYVGTRYVSQTNGLLPAGEYTFNELGIMMNPPSDEPTYDDGYQDGYNAGFKAGEDSVDTDSYYQQGYEAGLELGESTGYESGYNAGFEEGKDSVDTNSYYQQGFEAGKEAVDTEAIYQEAYEAGQNSIDTDSIYQEAFEAGKNSVDTDVYYDEGYQKGFEAGVTEAFAQGYQEGLDEGYAKGYDEGYDAGYAIGYSDGYSVGFDKGYQSALDRIEGWGADTSDYPVLVNEYTTDSFRNIASVSKSYPRDLVLNQWISLSHESNPNHTYKYVLQFDDLYMYRNSSADYVFSSDVTMDCDIGGTLYPIRADVDSYDVYYVPGDRVSTTLEIIWTLHNARVYDDDDIGEVGFQYESLNVKVYDMGPSGDTQNHIANQTDQLTGGYDNSQGNAVNSDLSTGLNAYQTAEDSLWATATTGLKDFTFFDFESVPAMITGMSFITAIMGSWFDNAGGASGVGIVLSILFSVMIVSMVLGLYRLYQSAGRRQEAREFRSEIRSRWKKGK